MITRRGFAVGMAAGLALTAGPLRAQPADADAYYGAAEAEDHGKVYRVTNFDKVDPRWRRQLVQYSSTEPQGTVVVDTRHHHLYIVFENGTALRYGVGVGRDGFKWYGRAAINRRAVWPDWRPPPEMLKRKPELPRFMPGGPDNPMGARSLYLAQGGRDTIYRIHGTNEPWSVGQDGSSGCIRLFTEDIIDLYQRCPIGTNVLVLPHIASRGA